MNSKRYKIDDGHQPTYTPAKRNAVASARKLSSTGTVVLAKLNTSTGRYEQVARFRFGKKA